MTGNLTPRCGDCRHWGRADRDESAESYRTCTAVVHDERNFADSWRDGYDEECKHWDGDPSGFHAIRARKAVVMDGSGYHAALRCREDFGCVLFEPKATQEGRS